MNTPPQYYKLDNWQKMPMFNTSGTRDKTIFFNNNDSFYFKTSLKKDKKDYVYEFWSEIVASQLGTLLRLPVLHYDIASFEDKIGCISQNMIETGKEELIEGVRLVIEIDANFKFTCKKNHHISKIIDSLKNKGVGEYKLLVIEMLLFDCIIGNTDRHSENWGLIKNIENLKVFENLSFFQKIKLYYKIHKRLGLSIKDAKRLCNYSMYRVAPFYDNGSSLARELGEQKILAMLQENSTSFDSYYNGGKPDIKLRETKFSFLETIEILIQDYRQECKHFIEKHLKHYNKQNLISLINIIDINYPKEGFEYARLSQQRKDFFVKLIDCRINHIKNIYYGKV